MSEKKNKLCARSERYGTLDLWINNEDHWNFGKDEQKFEVIATYNGETPEQGFAYMISFDKEPVKAIDNLMGYIGRDTDNWYFKDIVIHWGVHTWKFINSKNITTIEKDEYTKNLEDIEFNYEVEW